MLVLSRRESEQISIPELGITLQVIRIKGNSVKIGIDAPPEIRVLRGELQPRSELAQPAVPTSSVPYSTPPIGYVVKSRKQSRNETTVEESKQRYRVCCHPVTVVDEKIAC
jgi:carbon storage regulator